MSDVALNSKFLPKTTTNRNLLSSRHSQQWQ